MSEKEDSRSYCFRKNDLPRSHIGSTDRGPGVRLPLLEYLAAACSCMYLSDLRQRQYQAGLARALRMADSGCFSAWEWQDAAAYLTGETPDSASGSDIQAYLIKKFSGFRQENDEKSGEI